MTPFHLRERLLRLLAAEVGHEPGWAFCRELVRKSRSNFAYAFVFLPPAQRAALEAVYAFCRLADDAVDDEAGSVAEARERLAEWRGELDRVFGAGEPPRTWVGVRLASVLEQFPIRKQDLESVLDGCQMDLERSRYRTFEELCVYCDRVAGAVGLVCLEIFGRSTERTRTYALRLGTALQLTNILRDVGEDARRGRIYLPLEDLERFEVTEADLLEGRSSPALAALIGFEAQRAHAYFDEARSMLSADDRQQLLGAELMGDIYEALLGEIELHVGEVLETPPHVRRRRKLAIAVKRWLETRLAA